MKVDDYRIRKFFAVPLDRMFFEVWDQSDQRLIDFSRPEKERDIDVMFASASLSIELTLPLFETIIERCKQMIAEDEEGGESWP